MSLWFIYVCHSNANNTQASKVQKPHSANVSIGNHIFSKWIHPGTEHEEVKPTGSSKGETLTVNMS